MKASELEELRRAMDTRAKEILIQSRIEVKEAQAAPEVRTDVNDVGDASLRDEELATRADLDERDRQVLVAIREALARMEEGTYGTCVDCGDAIDLARLRAIPWTPRCTEDQERAERAWGRDPSPTL